MTACPACLATDTVIVRRHGIDAAATHFVPAQRDQARHERLRDELRRLFGADHVDIRSCGGCRFWFADPFVAGTPAIYDLVTNGSELYPADRFEFGETLRALAGRPVDVLEIGAGGGAFLRKARAAGIAGRTCATEFDRGALARLAAIPGVQAHCVSLEDLAASEPEPFDVVCMFQVLEHLDRIDDAFAALRRLTAPSGSLFISVPNDASVTIQEALTGFWEMPPNHVGRWSQGAIEAASGRHGFRLVEHRLEPNPSLPALWEMAKCRCQARAYDPSSLPGRVDALSVRPVRGALKRLLAVWDLLVLSPHWGELPSRSQWFRFEAA
jgi:2-polyprenyl-3-methyl-5-hydroxy-6-metoxy-1,4-benzoquinol methylase